MRLVRGAPSATLRGYRCSESSSGLTITRLRPTTCEMTVWQWSKWSGVTTPPLPIQKVVSPLVDSFDGSPNTLSGSPPTSRRSAAASESLQ